MTIGHHWCQRKAASVRRERRIKRYPKQTFHSLKGKKEKKVLKLIRRLGAEKYRVRKKAMKKLRKMGPEVMYYLKRNKTHSNPEIRRNVRQLIDEIARKNVPDLEIKY